jgi:oligopeptide transport system ATP-binding protein
MNKNLLEIKNLKISFFTSYGEIKAVDDISYHLKYGEVMGIVGESGSGKSVMACSILGLLPNNCKIINGKINFKEENILEYDEKKYVNYAEIKLV